VGIGLSRALEKGSLENRTQAVTYFTGWHGAGVISFESDQGPLGWRVVMAWTSDSKWIALHSTLATLLVLAWAYIPA